MSLLDRGFYCIKMNVSTVEQVMLTFMILFITFKKLSLRYVESS